MDLYSWLVLLVLFFIVVGIIYRANKKLEKKELEASKDIDDQFHFIDGEADDSKKD